MRVLLVLGFLAAFSAWAESPPKQETSGKISHVDAKKETFSLQSAAGVDSFKLSEGADTLVDGKFKSLKFFKDGDEVRVTYYLLGDAKMASKLEKGAKKPAR